jgi:hypothetical protein
MAIVLHYALQLESSKRIYEVTGIEALTIHRLLEFTHPGEPDPKTGKPVNFSYPKTYTQQPTRI